MVTRDYAMRKIPTFKADVISLNAGVYIVNTGSARQLLAWDIAKLMVGAFDNMEELARKNPVPFVALVKHNRRVVTYK